MKVYHNNEKYIELLLCLYAGDYWVDYQGYFKVRVYILSYVYMT